MVQRTLSVVRFATLEDFVKECEREGIYPLKARLEGMYERVPASYGDPGGSRRTVRVPFIAWTAYVMALSPGGTILKYPETVGKGLAFDKEGQKKLKEELEKRVEALRERLEAAGFEVLPGIYETPPEEVSASYAQ
jgi:hypothetical protein